MKKLLALLLSLTFVFSLSACGGKEDKEIPTIKNQSCGSFVTDDGYTVKTYFSKEDGDEVVFEVKNNGKIDIFATVNEDLAEMTVKPGEEKSVTFEIKDEKELYELKMVPTPNGGEIDCNYNISVN